MSSRLSPACSRCVRAVTTCSCSRRAEHVEQLRAAGLDAEPLDPRIAAVPVSDYEAKEGRERLHKGLHDLLARGPYERADLERAIDAFRPDVLIVDTNAYGGAVAAEASGLPWALSFPSLIPFPGKGIPPYGLGLAPMRGPLGRLRDKRPLRARPARVRARR